MDKNIITTEYKEFLEQLKDRVTISRYKAALSVNKELIILYHHIGSEILQKQRNQDWGTKIIHNLSKDMLKAFPNMKGFSVTNLHNMRRFAELYTDYTILQQVAGELPWYHHVILMERVKEQEARIFYMQQAVQYGWSRAVMIHQIDMNLYKHHGKAITNFKEKLPSPTSDLANQILKDPYSFDFLSIGQDAHEREIEKSLIAHIEKFLMELGSGFSFIGRQYHLKVSKKDYYLDLLFYHLNLRCFIAIEIKAVEFEPEHAGKMNFYLSIIDDQIKHPTDNPSIGLILCKTKDQVLAEYALRDMTKPIGLAEYKLTESLPENIKTALPTIEELEDELSKDFTNEPFKQKTSEYQETLDKLLSTINLLEQKIKSFSTGLEELENNIKISVCYEKWVLVQQQLPKSSKIQQSAIQIVKTVDQMMTNLKAAEKFFHKTLKKLKLSANKLLKS
ncbi:YhcG family protein [Candidatus Tisiphia endosymbiont of Oplodontha viridula]|uniref:PDDEXK nuclease domain-containing protein n=1 Tax=Candidatus Tisiphia endosymbiont of Oplodontha viridula TaxID=3077925 RepID=UPI0035C8BC9E